MDNQHRKIAGYRELSLVEIDAMNEVKAKGAELGALVEKLRANLDLDQRWVSIGATNLDLDQRWVSIGAMNLQTWLMALTRAIAKLWARPEGDTNE